MNVIRGPVYKVPKSDPSQLGGLSRLKCLASAATACARALTRGVKYGVISRSGPASEIGFGTTLGWAVLVRGFTMLPPWPGFCSFALYARIDPVVGFSVSFSDGDKPM